MFLEESLKQIKKDFLGRVPKLIQIVTVISLTTAQRNQLEAILQREFQVDPKNIQYLQDENILGGVIIYLDEVLIDGSLLRQLQIVRKKLAHAYIDYKAEEDSFHE